MCDIKRLSLCLLICLLLHESIGRRTRKTKRTKNDDDETTPQPSVVTYSSFGFNDVGQTYDGFVPSSPDYANYLSGFGGNIETSTRLYAPAFPSAAENAPFNMYGQQSESQTFTSGDSQGQPSNMNYQHSFNFMNPFENSENQYQSNDEVDKNSEDFNAQIYGAKIGGKNRMKSFSQFNSSQQMFVPDSFNSPGESFVQDPIPTQESKPSFSESNSYYNMYNYAPTYPNPSSMVEEPKPTPNSPKNMNYKKLLDFNKYKSSYPTEDDTSKFSTESPKPAVAYSSMTFNTNDNKFYNNYHDGNDNHDDDGDKPKPIGTNYLDYTINHIENSNSKPSYKNPKQYSKDNDYKDQFKNRPPLNYSDNSGWRNGLNKGYEYSNSNSSTSFRYDYSSKRPFKSNSDNDEVVGASSNVDLSNYKFPDIGTYSSSSFKKFPSFKPQASENYPSLQSYKYPTDDSLGLEFFSQMKNYYTTTPSSASHWDAIMKNNDYSQSSNSYKPRHKRPSSYSDETTDEIVHIPKRPHKYHIKHQGSKNSDWSSHNRHKSRPTKDTSSRFKSEEDLLGLRNHDTSHPSYIPSFKINANDAEDEFEKYASDNSFKNLVEKWRQSYLKSKKELKDTLSMSYRDHEAYGSESKPMHVPVPKPYPIEVPHPVIVPVPQPYPVRVPVSKPVAIPVVREITVPIEKPMPYPVIKKVPYPVEKPVPVTVEKEVPVPVMKPYPVPIPHVRPVFHHTKHHSYEDFDEHDSFEEDNYFPRPDHHDSGSKSVFRYSKKPRSTSHRNRYRRPSSHSHYYDRNRRRWPSRRPTTSHRDPPRSRESRPRPPTKPWQYAPSYKDYEVDDDGYYDYCKRSGNC